MNPDQFAAPSEDSKPTFSIRHIGYQAFTLLASLALGALFFSLHSIGSFVSSEWAGASVPVGRVLRSATVVLAVVVRVWVVFGSVPRLLRALFSICDLAVLAALAVHFLEIPDGGSTWFPSGRVWYIIVGFSLAGGGFVVHRSRFARERHDALDALGALLACWTLAKACEMTTPLGWLFRDPSSVYVDLLIYAPPACALVVGLTLAMRRPSRAWTPAFDLLLCGCVAAAVVRVSMGPSADSGVGVFAIAVWLAGHAALALSTPVQVLANSLQSLSISRRQG